jgi:hypothetical protein
MLACTQTQSPRLAEASTTSIPRARRSLLTRRSPPSDEGGWRSRGQISSDFRKSCQAPNQKIFRFTFLQIRSICFSSHPRGGALAIVTKRWDGVAVDAGGVGAFLRGRNADRVRRSRVVLKPRCWLQVGGRYPADDGDNKPAHRGEHDISRKAIAQGMSECFRSPVCSCAPLFAQFAHETAGAACTRHSLLPLFLRRDNEFGNNSGKPCREIADPHSLVIARLDRAPSIPEAAVIESREPGVLHTRIRGYDDRWW